MLAFIGELGVFVQLIFPFFKLIYFLIKHEKIKQYESVILRNSANV